ncbi:MAG: Wzz/FepE/Etk N-terminal domain-containing protein, partial [Candidatus Nanopelagicales bacterium]
MAPLGCRTAGTASCSWLHGVAQPRAGDRSEPLPRAHRHNLAGSTDKPGPDPASTCSATRVTCSHTLQSSERVRGTTWAPSACRTHHRRRSRSTARGICSVRDVGQISGSRYSPPGGRVSWPSSYLRGGPLTLQDYLRILRRSWPVILITTLVGALLALGVSLLMTPQYQAQAQLFVSVKSAGQAGDAYSGGLFVQQRVKSYVDVVDSPSVLAPVIDELHLNTTYVDLADRVSAQ